MWGPPGRQGCDPSVWPLQWLVWRFAHNRPSTYVCCVALIFPSIRYKVQQRSLHYIHGPAQPSSVSVGDVTAPIGRALTKCVRHSARAISTLTTPCKEAPASWLPAGSRGLQSWALVSSCPEGSTPRIQMGEAWLLCCSPCQTLLAPKTRGSGVIVVFCSAQSLMSN